jgi:glycosyltransferase involved in cell wall biosynthesis
MKVVNEQGLEPIPDISMSGRTAIIMPVYNEADTIEGTIRELYDKVASRLDFVDIWVFEDGSLDETKGILSKLSGEYSNLYVRTSPIKKGYPRAMREAFLSISPQRYSYVVSIDSDGQYEPNDFLKVFQTMKKNHVDIVMGRRTTRKEPPYRRLLSKGLQVLEKIMFPVRCKDVTSVMRIMKVKVAHSIAREVAYSPYNFWLEFTARMSLKQYSVIEIPINYRERLGGSKVYSVNKIPRVIMSEFTALRAVKREYRVKAAS